jgi:hypothetical protein
MIPKLPITKNHRKSDDYHNLPGLSPHCLHALTEANQTRKSENCCLNEKQNNELREFMNKNKNKS